jgi:FKBP-type peptidyl-prolyl cis-trans isomerase
VGTEKRERQRVGRLEKTVAQAVAAKRAKRRGNAIRIAVGTVLVLAVVFITSQLMGDDSDSAETSDGDDTSSETTAPETTAPDTTQPEYSNPEVAEAVLAREPPAPAPPPADTAADALESSTLIEGEGAGAQAGDTVVVHYSGVLSDGSTFDESWSGGQTFPVTLGQGAVIAGWDEGLVGAKIGERRHLVIGSDNAYGAQGSPPAIPANAPLSFDVDIVDIQPAG